MENNMIIKTKANEMREESHSISKPKPKIRIVHIFALEIIKIDAANFRELVQRLTGKPEKKIYGRKKKNNMRQVVTRDEESINNGWRELEKGNNSGGYLSEFGDVDGLSFLQGFGDLPMLNYFNSMDHILGEAQVI